jgi:hypothetical protein
MSLASHFKEMETYIQCNIQGQKLDPRCEKAGKGLIHDVTMLSTKEYPLIVLFWFNWHLFFFSITQIKLLSRHILEKENFWARLCTQPYLVLNKHIFVFTYELYKFIFVVYNDVHQYSNNHAFVAK